MSAQSVHPPHTGHLLVAALKRHRDRPVLNLGEGRLNGAQMADSLSQYIQALEALGAGFGHPIGLLSTNSPELVLVIATGQILGRRATALHTLGSLRDQAYILSDAGTTTLIIEPKPAFVERSLQLLDAVDSLQQILTLGPVPDRLRPYAHDLTAEAGKYPPAPLTARDLPPDHMTGLIYTGGTTGNAKGVISTTRAYATMTTAQLAEWEWPEDLRFLMCAPLSHAGAAFLTPTFVKGGEVIVLPGFEPGEVLAAIERHRVTATMLVPSMIYALLDHPDSHTRDLSSLQTVYYGASPMNPVRLAEAIGRLGPIFAQYYGQSEASMVITYLPKGEHDEKRLTSCGRPTIFTTTALIGSDGQPVIPGEVGEICVSGPLLSGGYWNLPEETANTFRDGWLHTGDLAWEDPDGYWHIVDRLKQVIITGGFNVYPRDVENVIAEHPSVSQVCVFGLPDVKWGETVMAVVTLRPGHNVDHSTLPDEIKSLVKAEKGSVQAPKDVYVVADMPLTPVGKPDRDAVRTMYLNELSVG